MHKQLPAPTLFNLRQHTPHRTPKTHPIPFENRSFDQKFDRIWPQKNHRLNIAKHTHLNVTNNKIVFVRKNKIMCPNDRTEWTKKKIYEKKCQFRCLDENRLFPVSKPIQCEEKSVNPFFAIKCCRTDNCNKFIRFELPERGEIYISPHATTTTLRQQKQKQNTH